MIHVRGDHLLLRLTRPVYGTRRNPREQQKTITQMVTIRVAISKNNLIFVEECLSKGGREEAHLC